ncbi:porin [Curvibacter sp. APW13]|uniref:porin n=1 Tax=Curvibacter sp. APW13 TaxID=3077236 RepID=UPI0028DE6BAF|nr:porin [Curvibacter sp. APW13]MDT8992548.1 porin [Curvibacter sp. APW13]
MKKTLVALAALAATGAFAQVTITGELAMGYQATTTGGATTADAGGLGVDTSQLWFNANEDLGGGTKIAASMSLAGADRSGESGDGSVRGRNATLTLTTNVGAFVLGSAKAADYLSGGVAGLGVYWNGFDNKVFSARSNRDTLSYILPVGAFTLTLSTQESAGLQGIGAGQTGDGVATGQRLNVIAGKYASGALVVDGQWLQFDSRGDNTDALSKDQLRLSGSYDLGSVQLGAGLTQASTTGKQKVTDSLVAIKVPMGALTLGAQLANRRVDDSTVLTNGSRGGYSLNAQYNMSKTTYVVANYARWDASVGAANASSQYNVLLVKDF